MPCVVCINTPKPLALLQNNNWGAAIELKIYEFLVCVESEICHGILRGRRRRTHANGRSPFDRKSIGNVAIRLTAMLQATTTTGGPQRRRQLLRLACTCSASLTLPSTAVCRRLGSNLSCIRLGTTEKARTENAAPSKMQGWKTREWKTRHQSAGVEKARKCIYSIDI